MAGHSQLHRVLGVDPGFDRIGIAVMEGNATLFSCCLETNRKLPHEKRLLQIGQALKEIIIEWQPQSLAIENLFFNQNTSTALKVAEARGVIVYEATSAGLNLYEYSPQAVKIAITGYGKADKGQMKGMIEKLTKLGKTKRLDDELDAIALCITHLATHREI